jgi:hypothetical protein
MRGRCECGNKGSVPHTHTHTHTLCCAPMERGWGAAQVSMKQPSRAVALASAHIYIRRHSGDCKALAMEQSEPGPGEEIASATSAICFLVLICGLIICTIVHNHNLPAGRNCEFWCCCRWETCGGDRHQQTVKVMQNQVGPPMPQNDPPTATVYEPIARSAQASCHTGGRDNGLFTGVDIQY